MRRTALARRTPLRRTLPTRATTSRQRTCDWCSQPFTPKNTGQVRQWTIGKYCSRECYLRGNKFLSEPKIFGFNCRACGAFFTRHAAHIRKFGKPKYCGRKCQGKARQRPGSTHHRGTGWRKLATAIRDRDGRRCVRCGAEEQGRQHHVDHILPWVMVGDDEKRANDPANLATLCDACHGRKTTKVEPRLLRGDWLAVQDFYGREVMLAAKERYQGHPDATVTEHPTPQKQAPSAW